MISVQVEAFRNVLNETSNDLRLLEQHAAEKKGDILVQKGCARPCNRSNIHLNLLECHCGCHITVCISMYVLSAAHCQSKKALLNR